jgi:hypothetical protein
LKILVACEESQAVTIELRKRGHEAYSCDIELCSGGHPEWHIQGDVLSYLGQYSEFITSDGIKHINDCVWDMVIAFPPCTYLTNAGAMRLRVKGVLQEDRLKKAREAKAFFMQFYNTKCPKVAIENPLPGKIHGLPPYSQIIEPYMFGEPWKKRTCLWLRGLQPLESTNIVAPIGLWVGSTSSRRDARIYSKYKLNSNRNSKVRSKTFPGIAAAMAAQWS